VYINVVEQRHNAPDQEQVGWNLMSMQALQYPPEYAMTLQVLMENHTGEDRTANRTIGHNAEVVVHDPSICVGSARNVESRMDLRTVYPTDQKYQQTT
jgi:hypothetical protein